MVTNPQTKTIYSITLRVAGPQRVTVDAHHTGTQQAFLGIAIGALLVYTSQREVCGQLRRGWEHAARLAGKLPRAAQRPTTADHAAGTGLAAAMVRLEGQVGLTIAGIPASSATGIPAHVRIQLGPLVWQVLDQTAYATIRDGLRHVEQVAAVALPR